MHTKALALHHKTESKYLLLKAEYEKNQLDMENMEKALENERANARDISDRIAEKAKEVEKLRVTRNTDEVRSFTVQLCACSSIIFDISFTAREGGETCGVEPEETIWPLLDAEILVFSIYIVFLAVRLAFII